MKRTEGEIEVASDDMLTVIYSANMDFSFPAKGIASREVKEANAEHITALWNASKDMTTEQAVAYLKYGAEMKELIYSVIARGHFDKICKCSLCALERMASKLLTKLEADDGK